jgi:dienelactone hydrolase
MNIIASRRSRIVTAACLWANTFLPCACVRRVPPPDTGGVAGNTPPRDVILDQHTDELMRALQQGDDAHAESMFDADMKAALPLEKVAALRTQLLAQLGTIDSWRIVGRDIAREYERRTVDVKGSKATVRTIIALDPPTAEIAGIFFVEAMPADGSGTPADGVHAEEVSVGSAPWVLGATLTIPKGMGPFPAIVLLGGSGPVDRDESVGANKPFRDISYGLAARGIMVLRFDKRTTTYGAQLDAKKVTLQDEYIADGKAALEFLRNQQGVDTSRIYLAGHSLGAWIAPDVAMAGGPVAGLVLLAPPSRPLPKIIVQQLRYLKAPPEKIAAAEKQAHRILDGELGEDQVAFGAGRAYWTDLLARNVIVSARKLQVPILILHGERDYQVLEEDIEGWRKGLSGQENVHIDTLPSLNHLFIEGKGSPDPAEYAKAGHVSEKVIDEIAAFVLHGRS